MVLKRLYDGMERGRVWEWCKNVWYSSAALLNSRSAAVWEWCKNVWYSSYPYWFGWVCLFENDVKTYGTQAYILVWCIQKVFENDVKTYGTQAQRYAWIGKVLFENDVKTYGTQAYFSTILDSTGLRMM